MVNISHTTRGNRDKNRKTKSLQINMKFAQSLVINEHYCAAKMFTSNSQNLTPFKRPIKLEK